MGSCILDEYLVESDLEQKIGGDMMYIVLLGPPGSGKGTQSSLLERRLNIRHLSTGDLFRVILGNPEHPLYPDVQVVNEGKLVSDEVVNKVVADGLTGEQFKDGALLDGYPRTVSQAKALDKMLADMGEKVNIVIDLDVTYEVLCVRLLGRRVCPECKRVFHVEDGIDRCPDCDMELIIRDDDNEKVIEERFKEYKEKTAPLQDYYRAGDAEYITITIDDAKIQADEVQKRISDELRRIGIN